MRRPFCCWGTGYAESLRKQPECFKHYVPGMGHKSEMGVPFRFHLAMADPEFRSFIGGRKYRNEFAAVW
jgi:site-specific DNA-methyltransferase (cytosine-N4-specific)